MNRETRPADNNPDRWIYANTQAVEANTQAIQANTQAIVALEKGLRILYDKLEEISRKL